MHERLATTRALLTAGLLLLLSGSLQAASIAWDDGDGGSGTLAGSWDNLQAAINNAEGAGNAGSVKISGDLARNAGVTTTGDLEVTAGNVAISGGWDAGFTSQSGRSTLNVNGANSTGDKYRVMQVLGSNTTLSSLKITGGYLNYTNGTSGGGIYLKDAEDSRISNCEITGNKTTDYSAVYGAGIYVHSTGSSTTPLLIENCKITDNEGVYVSMPTHPLWHAKGGGICSRERSYLVVANSEITGNSTSGEGGGVYVDTYKSRTLVFNSLIAENSNSDEDYGVKGAAVYVRGYGGTANSSRFVNSTIADNVDSSDANSQGIMHAADYGNATATTFINTILAENQGVQVIRTDAAKSARARFQHATVYEPTGSEVYYQVEVGGTDQFTNDLATALAWTSPDSLFHSVDDSGANQQTIQNELTADPAFASGSYELTGGSNSVDNGLTQTGTHADITGSFVYVDTDMDSVYDPAWDVIVDLQGGSVTGTSAMHLVYETDLLGNARIYGGGIDRGAYEVIPEPATVGLLGLGLAGLAVRRRRRRRT